MSLSTIAQDTIVSFWKTRETVWFREERVQKKWTDFSFLKFQGLVHRPAAENETIQLRVILKFLRLFLFCQSAQLHSNHLHQLRSCSATWNKTRHLTNALSNGAPAFIRKILNQSTTTVGYWNWREIVKNDRRRPAEHVLWIPKIVRAFRTRRSYFSDTLMAWKSSRLRRKRSTRCTNYSVITPEYTRRLTPTNEIK